MAQFVKFDKTEIQAIIGLIDEIEPMERTEKEDLVMEKALQIAALQDGAIEREKPQLFRDGQGRLSIQFGDKLSEPVGYKGIAKLGNLFAVTDYYKEVFPSNVLLRFFHANPEERLQFERARSGAQVVATE